MLTLWWAAATVRADSAWAVLAIGVAMVCCTLTVTLLVMVVGSAIAGPETAARIRHDRVVIEAPWGAPVHYTAATAAVGGLLWIALGAALEIWLYAILGGLLFAVCALGLWDSFRRRGTRLEFSRESLRLVFRNRDREFPWTAISDVTCAQIPVSGNTTRPNIEFRCPATAVIAHSKRPETHFANDDHSPRIYQLRPQGLPVPADRLTETITRLSTTHPDQLATLTVEEIEAMLVPA